MKFTINPEVIIQSISVVLSLVMIVYFSVKGKKTPLLFTYIACQVMVFIWSSGQALELMAVNRDFHWLVVRILYFSVCFIGISWLLLCLYFTGSKLLLSKRNIILLAILPLAMYSLVLTNDYHYLFFSSFGFNRPRQYGTFFWINILIQYTYCIIGASLLVRHSFRHFGYARKQSILLVSSMSIPLLSNALYIFKLTSPGFDITPVSFSVSFLLLAIATFRYRFLNILPIALKKIVNNMRESIIVIDNSNKIIKFNESFASNFPNHAGIKQNDDVSLFVSYLEGSIENTPESARTLELLKNGTRSPAQGELKVLVPGRKYFSVGIQPVFSDQKEYIGRIVSFNDITEYRELLDELNVKNSKLAYANSQLEEYAKTVEELTLTKERNRIARDVHDTLGHSMAMLIALLEVSTITCRSDPDKTQEKLVEALKVAREGLLELRRSISGLAPEKLESASLIGAIGRLVEDYKPSGMSIDFTAEGMDIYRNPEYSDTVYRICQESLTNSLRHGKATQVNIILRLSEGWIKLFIFDNGCGCKKINKGFGLKGMEQRVKDLGGSITYGSGEESGFNLHAEIPTA